MSDAKQYRASKQPTQSSKSKAKSLRKDQTPPEGLLWWILRRNQILGQRFRRQAPIGPYIADFYCHDLRLVVEVDGKHISGSNSSTMRDEIDGWNRKGFLSCGCRRKMYLRILRGYAR